MAIDINAIQGDINFQRSVARKLAEMRATGNWKASAIDSIFSTMAAGRERDYLAALRLQADKELQNRRLAQSQSQFDARLGLAKEGMRQKDKDDRLAVLASGAGVLASGATAYKKLQDDRALADEYRRLRGAVLAQRPSVGPIV
jgi:hypothetical protein